tara:strand:- start:433 stop:645 length:213 start_codon:yes stop_codon:yes gene_type:complete
MKKSSTKLAPLAGFFSGGGVECISHTRILIIFFQKWLIFNELGGYLSIFYDFYKKTLAKYFKKCILLRSK